MPRQIFHCAAVPLELSLRFLPQSHRQWVLVYPSHKHPQQSRYNTPPPEIQTAAYPVDISLCSLSAPNWPIRAYILNINNGVNSPFNQINTSPGQSFSNASPKISGLPGAGEPSTATVAPQYSQIPTMHSLEAIGRYPVSILVTRNSPDFVTPLFCQVPGLPD